MYQRIKTELVYWLFCRWRGHDSFEITYEWFISRVGWPHFILRACTGCGRVYPEDVEKACDVMDESLRKYG